MVEASRTTSPSVRKIMSPSTTKPSIDNSSPTSNPIPAKISAEGYARAAEMTRIFGEAVREAQEESRRLGVPNVYTINGVIHYELPDGTLTTEDPYPAMQAAKKQAP